MAQASADLLLLGQICMQQQAAKPAATQREAEKVKTASHSGLTLNPHDSFSARPPVLTIITYSTLHSGPVTSGFHDWLQSPPCLRFQ